MQMQLMSGWVLEFESESEWKIVNRGTDGKKRFFQIVPGPYSPVIDEEPELALSLGPNDYVDAKGNHVTPDFRVKGIIVKARPGEPDVLYRGNLTNFFGKDKGAMEDGCSSIELNGVKYTLYRLMFENKARMKGYTAFYRPAEDHSGPVQIVDAADLC